MLAVTERGCGNRVLPGGIRRHRAVASRGRAAVVAGLSIDGAEFFLATESPNGGTRGPTSAGCTTVRIELFVDDPVAVHKRAVDAGATNRGPVTEYQHPTTGRHPIKRMLQGDVVDPFGHIWLIGKILE